MADFDPANWIRIAADSVAELRRCDVFRVLDTTREQAERVRAYIEQHRPDLADEVHDCWEELKAGA